MRQILITGRLLLKIWIIVCAALLSKPETHYCDHIETKIDCSNTVFDIFHANRYPVNQYNTTNLTCKHCYTRVLEKGVFDTLPKLLELDFSHNYISNLSYNVFISQGNLIHLDLSYNAIEVLQYSLFVKLVNLIFLNIECNKIKALPDKIFSSQKNLMNLDLSSNKLTTLSDGVLEPLISVKDVRLFENPFNCDCNLVMVKIWSETRNIDTGATCNYNTTTTDIALSALSSGICLTNSSNRDVMFSTTVIIALSVVMFIISIIVFIIILWCRKCKNKKYLHKTIENGARADTATVAVMNNGQGNGIQNRREGTDEKTGKPEELFYYSSPVDGHYSYIPCESRDKLSESSEMNEENTLYADYFNGSRLEIKS